MQRRTAHPPTLDRPVDWRVWPSVDGSQSGQFDLAEVELERACGRGGHETECLDPAGVDVHRIEFDQVVSPCLFELDGGLYRPALPSRPCLQEDGDGLGRTRPELHPLNRRQVGAGRGETHACPREREAFSDHTSDS